MYLASRVNENLEEVKSIAFYLEEPMEVAPPSLLEMEWGMGNKGECYDRYKRTVGWNGSITEFFGFSIYGIPRCVYEWDGGGR